MPKAPVMVWLLATLLVAMASRIAELFDEQRNVTVELRAMQLSAMRARWLTKAHASTPSFQHPLRRALVVLHVESVPKQRAHGRRRTARGPPGGRPRERTWTRRQRPTEEKTC
jgi:hypothetical protein